MVPARFWCQRGDLCGEAAAFVSMLAAFCAGLLYQVITMAFCAHLLACVLYGVADCVAGDPTSCWLEAYSPGGGLVMARDFDPLDKYLASLYFAFSTMTTVG